MFKRIVLTTFLMLFVSACGVGCSTVPLTPQEAAASHAREEQRTSIEQDKLALSVPLNY